MFKVRNTKTGRFIRDAISGKDHIFSTIEHAEKWAANMKRDSVLNATAWNSVRATKYEVVAI